MDLKDLLAQISSGEGQENDLGEMSANKPEEDLRDLYELEFLKKGKLLALRYRELVDLVGQSQEELNKLKEELMALKHETRQTVDLDSGETILIDFSDSERVQQFWGELALQVTEAEALEEELNRLDDSEEVSEEDYEEETGEKEVSSAVKASLKEYNSDLLTEESDDLLDYL